MSRILFLSIIAIMPIIYHDVSTIAYLRCKLCTVKNFDPFLSLFLKFLKYGTIHEFLLNFFSQSHDLFVLDEKTLKKRKEERKLCQK